MEPFTTIPGGISIPITGYPELLAVHNIEGGRVVTYCITLCNQIFFPLDLLMEPFTTIPGGISIPITGYPELLAVHNIEGGGLLHIV